MMNILRYFCPLNTAASIFYAIPIGFFFALNLSLKSLFTVSTFPLIPVYVTA